MGQWTISKLWFEVIYVYTGKLMVTWQKWNKNHWVYGLSQKCR